MQKSHWRSHRRSHRRQLIMCVIFMQCAAILCLFCLNADSYTSIARFILESPRTILLLRPVFNTSQDTYEDISHAEDITEALHISPLPSEAQELEDGFRQALAPSEVQELGGGFGQTQAPSEARKLGEGFGQAQTPSKAQKLGDRFGQALASSEGQELGEGFGQALASSEAQELEERLGQALAPSEGQELGEGFKQAQTPSKVQELRERFGQAEAPSEAQELEDGLRQALVSSEAQELGDRFGQALASSEGQELEERFGQALASSEGQELEEGFKQAQTPSKARKLGEKFGQAQTPSEAQELGERFGQALASSEVQELGEGFEQAHAGQVVSSLGTVWPINRLHVEADSHKSKVELPNAFPQKATISTYQQEHCIEMKLYAQKVGTQDHLHQCPCLSPYLMGEVNTTHNNVSMELVQEQNPEVQPGGSWQPSWCRAYQHLAVIIPYRNRQEHLQMLLYHLHPILQRQLLNYTIFVVEQNSPSVFNKAALMDIGFTLSRGISDFDCYIFHDVDMLVEDDRMMYSCRYSNPIHMGAYHSKAKYKKPYGGHFGGVVSLTSTQFQAVDGYSLNYWGWGNEDDDMATRLKRYKYKVKMMTSSVARYTMIMHERDDGNKRTPEVRNMMKTLEKKGASGLSTLPGKYQVLKTERRALYTRILVNLTGNVESVL